MTYNFDPDRWFDNKLSGLELKLKRNEISREEFDKEHKKLEDEYEEMIRRLDIQASYANRQTGGK